MKKINLIIALCLTSTIILCGCLDESVPVIGLPSDEECLQEISAYLEENSNFYDTDDTIYLGEWEGIGCQTRTFEWTHTQFPENPEIPGTYCGLGSINCMGEIDYGGN